MLSAIDIRRIKNKITNILQTHAGVAPARTINLLPRKSLQGKLYEADVLATICEQLVKKESFSIKLIGGTNLQLKQKGGPINRTYPYFEIRQGANLFGEMFTDVYFDTLSNHLDRSGRRKTQGDYHELDIAILQPGLSGNPKHSDVILAVECKNTSIKKSIIRELLGFRRELSFLSPHPLQTNFNYWPTSLINSDPNSVHMLYCSDHKISRYKDNCSIFGILLQHHRM